MRRSKIVVASKGPNLNRIRDQKKSRDPCIERIFRLRSLKIKSLGLNFGRNTMKPSRNRIN